jgi:guanylate kinase
MMKAMNNRPLLIVVSAPSGAGKTTLCERLLSEFASVRYSVSCTPRAPREGEENGIDYTFLTEAEFETKAAAGEFLEHATVHGRRYGTLRKSVSDALGEGRDVLMDIDVQGAEQIRALLSGLPPDDPMRRAFVDVFIAPPSIEILRARLKGRGKDSEEVIERRMKQASHELARWNEYRYFIVNDRLDVSYDALRSIVIAERHLVLR